jgi:hypothetical protein
MTTERILDRLTMLEKRFDTEVTQDGRVDGFEVHKQRQRADRC